MSDDELGFPYVLAVPNADLKREEPSRLVIMNWKGKGVAGFPSDVAMEQELSDVSPLLADLGLDDAPDGVSIWQGKVRWYKCGYPGEEEWNSELIGEFRRPTADEMAALAAGVWPWPNPDECDTQQEGDEKP